jgi:hypothetical protein
MKFDFIISRRRRFTDEPGTFDETPRALRYCKGNSSTQSNPTTSTDITDNRVAASEGSISAGSGASVSVQSVDAETVGVAADAIARVAESANDTAEKISQSAVSGAVDAARTATMESADVAKAGFDTVESQGRDALDFGRVAVEAVQSQGRDALDFGESLAQTAIKAAQTSQESANSLIAKTNDQFTARLVQNSGEAPTALADNVAKYIAVAVGIVGVAYVLKSSAK